MKAVVYTKYGPPEVAQLMVVDKPIPKDNEVLIKVYASTVNRTDSGFRSAEYFISRFWSGILKPKYPILGCEFAGIIEETGKHVTTFKIGDKVFGFNAKTFGGHGEYLTIAETAAITALPNNLSFEEAAAITEGAHYALCDIRAAKVSSGQNILVYGATGAIGSTAVQLLKHFGTTVTAVCNTKNVALVKSLGADNVINYETEDFTKTEKKFDFILDAVGKSSFGKCKPLLNKNGIYISTELGKHAENIFFALTTPITGGKKVLFPIPTINKEDVEFLKNLVEKGVFKPVIDRYYKLEEIVEAYKYVESGQKIEKEVKLKETDFEKVNVLLENIAADNIKDLDNSHYLFDFTEEELIEIIKKPDEWAKEDYLIAKNILKNKGKIFSTQQLSELKQERINALAKPESADKLWTMLGYLFSLIGGIIGVFIGWHLAKFKKTLPNGQKVYNYTEFTRLQGRIIFSIGLVCIMGWILYIIRCF